MNLKWFRPGGQDFPLGLTLTFLVLFATALVNLFTKQVATVSGVAFTLGLFLIFVISEKLNGHVAHAYGEEPEKFNLELVEEEMVDPIRLGLFATQKRLVAIRDPNNLEHLHRYLSERDAAELIALTVRTEKGLASSDGATVFSDAEEKLFSRVVKICEDHGRAVTPLVVVSNDQVYAIARMAYLLGVDEVVMGVSERFQPDTQLENFAMHWGSLGDSEHHVKVRVLSAKQDIRAEI
jgi:hypothetical protein